MLEVALGRLCIKLTLTIRTVVRVPKCSIEGSGQRELQYSGMFQLEFALGSWHEQLRGRDFLALFRDT